MEEILTPAAAKCSLPCRNKTIGIVGGMGPHAGTALFNTILDSTQARQDQDYPSIILVSFPKHIGDRTLYLIGKEKFNPAYGIAEMIGKLYAAGATVIGMACNTAHSPAIYDVVLTELERKKIAVEMVNMPMETYRYIRAKHPNARKVGIMATNGTYLSGVYRDLLTGMGYEVIMPDAEFQDGVIHKMIYDPDIGIKACPSTISNEIYTLADRAVQFFEQRHADVIVLGCTELSLLFKQDMVRGMPLVDSLKSLARALILSATSTESPLF
jgi:aspartate racemase